MNKLIKFTFMVIFIFVASVTSYAEGGGKRATGGGGKITDHGINRRVVSKTGYTGVKGTLEFSSTDVQVPSLPSDKGLSDYFKKSKYFKNNAHPYNIYKSLPTYYLGSTGPAEADAGIQYYNGDKYDAGWGAFIKGGAVPCTPKVFTNGAWQGVHSSASSFKLTYYIDEIKGSVWLEASGLSGINKAFPYPTDPNAFHFIEGSKGKVFPDATDALTGIYSTSSLSSVKVKRVIGITQGAPLEGDKDTFTYKLDGSITTLTYTGGFVHKKGASKDTWTQWTPSIVDQTKTGYDVDQDAKDAKWGGNNGQDTVLSQHILTFPNIDELKDANGKTILTAEEARNDARTDTHHSRTATENKNSRYVHETVKISLRSATKVTGEKSTVRSKSK